MWRGGGFAEEKRNVFLFYKLIQLNISSESSVIHWDIPSKERFCNVCYENYKEECLIVLTYEDFID